MKERISGALTQIHRGIEFVSKSVCDSPKDEMRYLRLAIEEITSGLAVLEDHLAEMEGERRTAATQTAKVRGGE